MFRPPILPNMTSSPIIVVGGVTSWPGSYQRFVEILREVSGSEVHVASLTPLDWLRSRLLGSGQLAFEVASAVDRALLESDSDKAVLVGHSAGGIACRIYLGGDPPYGGRRFSGHRRVSRLITLGSPHAATKHGTLPLIGEANHLFPGALHPDIGYLSVASSAVSGADSRRVRKRYERFVADGRVEGDGVVPVEAALLPDSETLVLEGLLHNRHLGRWYGSDLETVERWWPQDLRESKDLVAEPGA